jgi:hypothetical protein
VTLSASRYIDLGEQSGGLDGSCWNWGIGRRCSGAMIGELDSVDSGDSGSTISES